MWRSRRLFRCLCENAYACALCEDAPCTKACGKMDCGSALRSIWFDNEEGAAEKLPKELPCAGCKAPCEEACIRHGRVAVKELMQRLHGLKAEERYHDSKTLSKLRTNICGIPLENPFLLSSSVVASTYDMCARAFEMGWAGAAFKTICYLDIHEASPRFSAIKGDNGSIQITTAVMQYGYRIIDDLIDGLLGYLNEKGFQSVEELVGLGLDAVRDTQDLERDSIVYPKFVRSKCIGCGRCAISCRDGGHQAIHFGEDRKPVLVPQKCVGCHLCTLVCPEQAIVPGRKRV